VERSKPTVSCYQGQIYVMGGLTANQAIYEAMAERFNFETESWDKVTYDGFDYPFLTNCTATTSLAPLRNKQSLFLFGGSNTENMSNLIQPVDIAGGRSDFQLNHLKTINQMRLPRINPVLGLIKEDTLICFGGLEECHSFLNV
jgi:N-acetylneuraminic acid mutarotase